MKKPISSVYKYILPAVILLLIVSCFVFYGVISGSGRSDGSGGSGSAPVREDQLTLCEIAVPGLTREYNFLFLTDLHTVIPDEKETQQIKDYTAERLSVFKSPANTASDSPQPDSGSPDAEEPQSGSHSPDAEDPQSGSHSPDTEDPQSGSHKPDAESSRTGRVPALADWVSYVSRSGDSQHNQDQRAYDGLLLGGDIIDFPSSANLTYLDSSLKKLTVPYLYTPGNHDWTYPWEYMTEKGRDTYLPLLAPYMDGNTAIHTLEYEDLILVAINNSSNQIDPEALDLYRQILQKKKPVVLLLHVPLYTEELLTEAKKKWNTGVILGGGIHGGIYPDQTSTEFLNLTLAADSPVAAVLSGHVHFGKSSVLKREKREKDVSPGEKDIPQITGNAGFTGHATVVRLSVLSAQ